MPVIILDHMSEAQRRAYRIADNKLTELGGWDEALLSKELQDLLGDDYDLSLIGFDDGELDRLLNLSTDGESGGEEGTAPVVIPEPPRNPVSRAGDLWRLGDHRLLCGDSTTGQISLFANILDQNQDNPGGALGNIAFDAAHQQLFVSDESTGMIHRLTLDGVDHDAFDHGVTGRSAAKLPPVPFDPKGRLDITSSDFDPTDPGTYGYTDDARRVWGLAVHDGRLYYAVIGDSQIWSVGLDKTTGDFLNDARWELDVPQKPKKLPVSDILFTHKGAMILAQRGPQVSIYDYLNFADYGKSRVYRYWLENPDNPHTPSRWIAEPEEYAVGFEPEYRSTDGGLALNYGYTKEGYLDPSACETSLWTTGDNLRNNVDLKDKLFPGGPLVIDGLQGMPAGPVKQDPPDRNNTPPWASYMVDIDPANTDAALPAADPIHYSDNTTTGWMGDIAIYRVGCGGALGGGYGGAGYGWTPGGGSGGGGNGGGGNSGGGDCTPGIDCPPDNRCAIPSGHMTCDKTTGSWFYQLTVNGPAWINAVSAVSLSPPVSVPGGPFSLSPAKIPVSGPPGSLATVEVCAFDAAAAASGNPYDCCRMKVRLKIPSRACEVQK